MARVSGPLMSVDASGSVAKTIVFAKWRGRNYVRRFAVPANPRTAPQVTARAIVKFLGAAWASLSPTSQATWEPGAESRKISAFNEYVGVNARKWRDQLPPSPATPPTQSEAAPAIGVLTATASARQILLSIPYSGGISEWGIVVVRSLTTGVTGVPANAIAILPAIGTPVSFADGPLSPDTYFYNAFAFSQDGLFGAIGTEASATVV